MGWLSRYRVVFLNDFDKKLHKSINEDFHLWPSVTRRVTIDAEGVVICDEPCHSLIPSHVLYRPLPNDVSLPVTIKFERKRNHKTNDT